MTPDKELRRLAEEAQKVAPQEWDVRSAKSDTGPLYYSVTSGKYDLVDTLNSDAAEIHFEHDEDGTREWDEVGKLTTAFIAAANPAAILALLDRLAECERDARRYRYLRDQFWPNSKLFVVAGGKENIRVGTDCPSLDRLDAAIDALLATYKD